MVGVKYAKNHVEEVKNIFRNYYDEEATMGTPYSHSLNTISSKLETNRRSSSMKHIELTAPIC